MRGLLALHLAAVVFSLVAGCANLDEPASSSPPPPARATASPAPTAASAARRFGAPVTERTPTALSSIVADPSKFGGKTVRLEGKVTAVCKSMGCWMEIGDDATQAHIQMAGHSFFVPRDSSGHRAVVQGKVLAEAAPTCGDGCRSDGAKPGAKLAKVEVEATGVELVD